MAIIVGIDEAGRGPLAGPVTIGLFGADQKIRQYILKHIFDNKLRDSKKLSEKQREVIFKQLEILQKEGKIFFTYSHISNKIIDKIGISRSIQIGVNKNLEKFEILNFKSTILLDGSLKASKEFINQKTIIKGDEKDVFIACASIIAKVSRDRLMQKLAKKYKGYGLEIHKGYGTLTHRQAIRKLGLSPLHRKSFCTKIDKI